MYLIYLLLVLALFVLWLMIVPNYKQIIKRAWHITQQNRTLWLFGFLAILLGFSGELDIIFNKLLDISGISDSLFSFQSLFQGGVWVEILNNFKNFFAESPFQATLIILFLLITIIVLIWLVIVGQIGLIYNILRTNNNEKVKLKEGFRQGKRFFWSVFWLNLFAKIFIYGLLFIVGLPLIFISLFNNSLSRTVIIVFVTFIILVPLSIIISFIVKYALIFIIYKNYKIKESIRASFRLFKKYWLVSIEIALLILGFALFSALALIVVLVLIASPFFLLGIFGLVINIKFIVTIAIILGLIVIFLAVLIYGAILTTFQFSSWTLLFLDLIGEEKTGSKIVRIIAKIFPFLSKK